MYKTIQPISSLLFYSNRPPVQVETIQVVQASTILPPVQATTIQVVQASTVLPPVQATAIQVIQASTILPPVQATPVPGRPRRGKRQDL